MGSSLNQRTAEFSLCNTLVLLLDLAFKQHRPNSLGCRIHAFGYQSPSLSDSAFPRALATFIFSLPNVGEEPLHVTWLQDAVHLFNFPNRQICNELLDELFVDGSWALERKSRQFELEINGSRFAGLWRIRSLAPSRVETNGSKQIWGVLCCYVGVGTVVTFEA